MSGINLPKLSQYTILAASFSQAAYPNTGGATFVPPVGFREVVVASNTYGRIQPDTGFEAKTFVNPQTGQVIIAYRGSDGPGEALTVAKWSASTGSWHPQFTNATNYAKAAQTAAKATITEYGETNGIDELNRPKLNVLLTGHSLGGLLAQVVSKMYGLPAEVFDSLGEGKLVVRPEFIAQAKALGLADANGNIIDYDVAGMINNYAVSIASSSGIQLGSTTEIPALGQLGGWAAVGALGAALLGPFGIVGTILGDQLMGKHSMLAIEVAMYGLAALKDHLSDQGELSAQNIKLSQATGQTASEGQSDPNVIALVNSAGQVVAYLGKDGNSPQIVVTQGESAGVKLTLERIGTKENSPIQVTQSNTDGSKVVLSQAELLSKLKTPGTNTISTTTQQFDDGSSVTTTSDTKGILTSIVKNSDGSIFETSTTTLTPYGTEIVIKDGAGHLKSNISKQTDDEGNVTTSTATPDGKVVIECRDPQGNKIGYTITETPDGKGGVNRVVTRVSDGKVMESLATGDAGYLKDTSGDTAVGSELTDAPVLGGGRVISKHVNFVPAEDTVQATIDAWLDAGYTVVKTDNGLVARRGDEMLFLSKDCVIASNGSDFARLDIKPGERTLTEGRTDPLTNGRSVESNTTLRNASGQVTGSAMTYETLDATGQLTYQVKESYNAAGTITKTEDTQRQPNGDLLTSTRSASGQVTATRLVATGDDGSQVVTETNKQTGAVTVTTYNAPPNGAPEGAVGTVFSTSTSTPVLNPTTNIVVGNRTEVVQNGITVRVVQTDALSGNTSTTTTSGTTSKTIVTNAQNVLISQQEVTSFDDGTKLKITTDLKTGRQTFVAVGADGTESEPTYGLSAQATAATEQAAYGDAAALINAIHSGNKLSTVLYAAKLVTDFAAMNGADAADFGKFLNGVGAGIGVLSSLKGLESKDGYGCRSIPVRLAGHGACEAANDVVWRAVA